jgi:hypothetical protein
MTSLYDWTGNVGRRTSRRAPSCTSWVTRSHSTTGRRRQRRPGQPQTELPVGDELHLPDEDVPENGSTVFDYLRDNNAECR